MKYIKIFKEHSLYDASKGELEYPSLSYCEKENEVHYMPSNSIMFYVGDLSGKTDQVVTINYSGGTHDTVSIQEPNKWYSHNIPNGKTLSSVTNLDYIKEAVVNCDEAFAQNWKKVDKVSYYNCKLYRDSFYDNFNGSKFTSLDVRTVDTSNVIRMTNMFSGCNGLTELDVSSFDTSKVTNMESMFNSCHGLTSLDLSNFNTSNVTTMESMFIYCSGLTSLDVSNFDTSKVTKMDRMFSSCSGLTSLDLSNFNTSKVTDIGLMFYGCTGLTSLDLSNFNTSNVTKMGGMFLYNRNLTSLDLSGWDMTNVTDTSSMFEGCSKLTTITMKGCNQATIEKIKSEKPSSATIITE